MKALHRSSFLHCSTLALILACPSLTLAQNSLPFPEPERPKAQLTMGQSAADYKQVVKEKHLPADAPNIVIIMLDDVGPALSSAFGGPINTPTMERVVDTGVAYNRFHTTAMCSPTRAALLTGRNHHRTGFGQIAEFANDWDGYTGAWPATSASLAKVLGYYGYTSSAFGKWHNTPATDTSAVGPFERWPTGQLVGFDYFYGFLSGETSQWEPALVENTRRLPAQHEREGYHLTEDVTDKAIDWIKTQHTQAPDRPFLVYWAPGAAHGPHHIFKEWADKYDGRFDEGWEALREEMFAKQKEIGWLPQDAVLSDRHPTMASWDDIPQNEREFQTRLMEVFAGFAEHADTQAGRLVDTLEELGIRDNTLILYVWGDNGSSSEGQGGTVSELMAQNGIATNIADHLRVLDEIGGLDQLGGHRTDNMYHAGWAWAGSAPYQGTKLLAGYLGGTRTPLAVSWPAKLPHDKTPRSQFYHVNDIVPTIYDILDITPPTTVDGVTQDPMDGVSMVASLTDAKAPENKHSQYFEVMGSRAYYEDGWMASVFGPRVPWAPGFDPAIFDWSPEKDTWELYNLSTDFSQAKDIAADHPEKLAAMIEGFNRTAEENKAFPIGGGLWSTVFHPEYSPRNPATEFSFTQDVYEVPEFNAPKLGSASTLVSMEVDLQPDSEGVLYALGAYAGGLALWVDDGNLAFEFNTFQVERTRIETTEPLPTGPVKIEVESLRPEGPAMPMDVTIRIEGVEVAKGRAPRTPSLFFTTNDTFDIGRDSFSPVVEDYFERAPFKYNGKIGAVNIKYIPSPPAPQ
ncbi:arylsulfatase [Paracoccus sp. PAR01]|uniref:arylsulfatase n=1 Tax=Paracoccus sp. PAR01 TaxID=2769282 RepID=UPI0017830B94|nr:arylsulfatase [Paracoccus sp. PAR01]MBD9529576.1 arylsulfatase [Paracoccus sp. PAR01]